jgi:hypothetical protein
VLSPAFHELVGREEYASLGERFEDEEHRRFGERGSCHPGVMRPNPSPGLDLDGRVDAAAPVMKEAAAPSQCGDVAASRR